MPPGGKLLSRCKTTADFKADFDLLKKYTSIVRTYAAVDGAEENNFCQTAKEILPAVKDAGMKVILGVW